eukprot:GHUV01041945.1.p2 GENE.GHUV01041945.1~~GHUV01041945.1.p2  ORF type:complete len:124 (+),score=18.04 GHUV01041945.1:230-601(+)
MSACPLLLQLVFTEVALGAIVLTINVILLGGNIVFFQSLCLIGYCLFPIVIAAIICVLVKLAVSSSSQVGFRPVRRPVLTNIDPPLRLRDCNSDQSMKSGVLPDSENAYISSIYQRNAVYPFC